MTSARLRLEDVAKAVGVSKATVDRVIHDRPGVREETAQRVRSALAEFGYARSALAAQVGPSPLRVEVLMPVGDRNFFLELRSRLEQRFAFAKGRFIVNWTDVPKLDSQSLLKAIATVDPASDCVMLVGVDDHHVTDAIDLLVARGVRVVTFVADVPRSRRAAHVGLDNFSCGRLAGSLMARFIGQRPGYIQILAGSPMLRDQIDRVSGFNQLIQTEAADRLVKVRFEDWDGPDGERDVVRSLLAGPADLAGIYVAGGSNRRVAEALAEVGKGDIVVIGHEFTHLTRAALVGGQFDAIIALDHAEMARRLVELAQGGQTDLARHLEARIIMRENLPPIEAGISPG